MGRFWRKKNAVKAKRDGKSLYFTLMVEGGKTRAASWLQVQSEKLSSGKKRLFFFLICLLAGVYSVALITGSIKTELRGSDRVIKPVPFTTGDHSMQLEKVKQYRIFLDSLKLKNPGQLEKYPGLLDSIIKLEQQLNHEK